MRGGWEFSVVWIARTGSTESGSVSYTGIGMKLRIDTREFVRADSEVARPTSRRSACPPDRCKALLKAGRAAIAAASSERALSRRRRSWSGGSSAAAAAARVTALITSSAISSRGRIPMRLRRITARGTGSPPPAR